MIIEPTEEETLLFVTALLGCFVGLVIGFLFLIRILQIASIKFNYVLLVFNNYQNKKIALTFPGFQLIFVDFEIGSPLSFK